MTDSLTPTLRTNALASGFDGVPWPEFWRSRPALVVPQVPGVHRPIDPGAGWSTSPTVLEVDPEPGWALVQQGRGIAITAPGDALWFKGFPLLTRDWRRAATAQRTVILISGPFARIDQFSAAAASGSLKLLLVAAR